jgi:hypothetical protein
VRLRTGRGFGPYHRAIGSQHQCQHLAY